MKRDLRVPLEQSAEAEALVGKYVRFAYLPAGCKPTPRRVTGTTRHGMIRLEGWVGDFAPHLFEVVDQPTMFDDGDQIARAILLHRTKLEFAAENFEAVAMLAHAEVYLSDRRTYELFPWPKGILYFGRARRTMTADSEASA
jgi:hypothetical protein